MTNRYRAELIIGGATPLAATSLDDLHAAVASDLDRTQIVEHTSASRRFGRVTIRATYLAAGRPEAEAAAERAGRATGLPFDVARVTDEGGAR